MTRARPTVALLCLAALAPTAGGCFSAPGFVNSRMVGSKTRASATEVPRRAPASEAEATAVDAAPPAAAPRGGVGSGVVLAPQPPQPGEPRQVVYSASFTVVVADVPGTLRAVREHAETLGGHLQEVTGGTITVRVPAGRFNDAVAYVEQIGEVVDRQVSAQDVTEDLRDLRIHLDNDEKLRRRLQALLDKAERVEDVLKIEAELSRVSGEIERAQGRLRFVESQVAMSSLRVALNASVPQDAQGAGPRLPFDWVGELGAGLVEGQVRQRVKEAGFFGRGPRFRPPAGFVRYYEDGGEVEAMDANGLRVRVLRRANVDKAGLSFWARLARKTLVEARSLAVAAEEPGDDFYLLRGTRDVGGKPVGYLLCVKRSNRTVVAFEAWGPHGLFDENLDALRMSALSIDPG